MITVTNKTTNAIEVAINKWGDDGNTGFFKIEVDKSETWDRNNEKGFVMSVEKNGGRLPYYVVFDSDIIVTDREITDRGRLINPVN